jgi:predicted LPLAT superfamily acyltransferase
MAISNDELAALAGRLDDLVRRELEKGIEVTGKSLCTALRMASKYGETETVRLLLERGAEVDGNDTNGNTALHWASLDGHLDTVRLLLERGADADGKNKNGRTALDFAKAKGHSEVVTLLAEIRDFSDIPTEVICYKNARANPLSHLQTPRVKEKVKARTKEKVKARAKEKVTARAKEKVKARAKEKATARAKEKVRAVGSSFVNVHHSGSEYSDAESTLT